MSAYGKRLAQLARESANVREKLSDPDLYDECASRVADVIEREAEACDVDPMLLAMYAVATLDGRGDIR